MASSKITQVFRKNVFPSHLLTYRGPDLFQSSLLRPYTKTINVSCSVVQSTSRSFYSTKENGEINKEKENLEKNKSVKEIEQTIVEESGKHSNESEKTPPPSSCNKSSPYLDKFVKDTAENLPVCVYFIFPPCQISQQILLFVDWLGILLRRWPCFFHIGRQSIFLPCGQA